MICVSVTKEVLLLWPMWSCASQDGLIHRLISLATDAAIKFNAALYSWTQTKNTPKEKKKNHCQGNHCQVTAPTVYKLALLFMASQIVTWLSNRSLPSRRFISWRRETHRRQQNGRNYGIRVSQGSSIAAVLALSWSSPAICPRGRLGDGVSGREGQTGGAVILPQSPA